MEEWKEYKLGEVCKSIADGDHMPPPKSDKGIPFVTISNIVDKRLDFSNTHFVPQTYYDGLDDKRRPHIGDTIYSVVGTFGKPVYVKEEKPFVFQRHIAILRPDESKIVPQFLFYSLLSPQFYRKADVMAIGAVQRTISLTSLRNATIQLPPLDVQSKIVDMFSSLDDKIEVNRKINENLEQQAQALFKSWFVDFEPFKNGEFVESELGIIPKGWRVGKLGEICNVFTGKKDVKQSQPIGLYPFFSCSPNHTYSNEYIYDGPSIIIAGNGSYTGRTSFYFGKFDLYQRTYACTIKEGFNEKIISFLYYMMKCLFEPVKMGGTRGSSIPYIVMNDIVLQKFALDNSLVEKYSDFAYNVMKQIQQNNQESRRLATLRDTLLPKLMSGELKVNELN